MSRQAATGCLSSTIRSSSEIGPRRLSPHLERLESNDGVSLLDAGQGLDLFVDEMADVGAVGNVEFHQEVVAAGGGIDLGGDLGVGKPVRHVIGLAKLALDLDEEGNHRLPPPGATAPSEQN